MELYGWHVEDKVCVLEYDFGVFCQGYDVILTVPTWKLLIYDWLFLFDLVTK